MADEAPEPVTRDDFAKAIAADCEAFQAKCQESFKAQMAQAQKNFLDSKATSAEMQKALGRRRPALG